MPMPNHQKVAFRRQSSNRSLITRLIETKLQPNTVYLQQPRMVITLILLQLVIVINPLLSDSHEKAILALYHNTLRTNSYIKQIFLFLGASNVNPHLMNMHFTCAFHCTSQIPTHVAKCRRPHSAVCIVILPVGIFDQLDFSLIIS